MKPKMRSRNPLGKDIYRSERHYWVTPRSLRRYGKRVERKYWLDVAMREALQEMQALRKEMSDYLIEEDLLNAQANEAYEHWRASLEDAKWQESYYDDPYMDDYYDTDDHAIYHDPYAYNPYD